MPQLEFSTFAAQIFWLSIIFTILYIYLSRGPLPVIMEVLHSRQSRIASDLQKAESLKMEAEAAEEDFTSAIAEARQNASKILNNAKVKVALEEASRNAKMEQNFAHQNKEAEQRVVMLRKEAIAKLVPIAASAAALMAEKLIDTKVDLAHAQSIALDISKEISIK